MNGFIHNQAKIINDAVNVDFCKAVINNYTEKDFKPCNLNGTPNSEYRNSSEIKITNQDLIRSLWNQIKYYAPEQCNGKKIVGIHKSRVYLLKYTKGQYFSKHSDGHSVDSKGNVSQITGIVYLNTLSVDQGGQTRFYHGNQVHDVTPKAGAFLYFLHTLVHEGMVIKSGYKYAVRFNILYQK